MAETEVQLNPTRQPNGERVVTDKNPTNNRHYQKVKVTHGADGTFTDSTYENPFPTNDYFNAVALGLVSNAVPLRKFGFNPGLGTAALLVAPDGLTQPFFAQTAVQAAIWSSSANDAAAGSHMRTMIMEGLLGTSWALGTATVSMAGTATATTAQSWHRVFRSYSKTAGIFGNSNAGTVTIAGVGTSTFMLMDAGFGQSEHAHFCVPAGKTWYVRDVHITADASKAVNVNLWQIPNGTSSNATKRIVERYTGVTGSPDFEYEPFQKYVEFTDVWADSSTASAGGGVSVELNGILVDD